MSVLEMVSNQESESACGRIEAIRNRANPQQMLNIPFFKHLKQHRLNEREMRDFFLQYYSIVKVSYRMLAAGILNTKPEDSQSISHLVRFLETESGGDPSHLTHYLRWAQHFGLSTDDLAQAEPNEKSRAFEDTLMGYFSGNDSFVQRAAQLGLEDCAEVLIEGLDQGFRKYNIPTRANGYLMIHLLLENDEDGHSRWAIDSLATAPGLQNRWNEIETIYRRVYDAFEGVFNGIYEEWSQYTAH